MDSSKKDQLKEKIIINRLNRVYCRLKPSPIHGIGIFAIRPIPKGTNPFKDSYMAQEAILISRKKIPSEFEQLLEDYHPSSKNQSETQRIVSNYPNQLIWTNYINYSDEPNIELMSNGEWMTLRDIQVDEELVEDPKRLFNADGTHKVFTIRPGQYPTIN